MSMVFCRGCGREIHESAHICPKCGALQDVQTISNSVVPDKAIPEGIKGWSWGAFLLSWVWSIGNKTWIGLLALIPFVGFIMVIVLGFKGREWAWKNKHWSSVEEFNRVQKQWSFWGVIWGVTVATIGIVGAAISGINAYYSHNRAYEKAAQVQMESEMAKRAQIARTERKELERIAQQQQAQERENLARQEYLQAKAAQDSIELQTNAAQKNIEQVRDEHPIVAPSNVQSRTDLVASPKYLVGEKVVLESIDHQNPKLNNSTERIVHSLDDRKITFKSINVKSGYTRYLNYTKDLALISTSNEKGDVTEFDPPLPFFKFPLKIGDSWAQDSVETLNGVAQRKHKISGKIVNTESIDSKLGTHVAMKIVIESSVQANDGSISTGTDTSWYVPSLKRTVKSELTSQDQNTGKFSSKTVRLISYSNP